MKESKQFYQKWKKEQVKISVFCSFCPLLDLISYPYAQQEIYQGHRYLKAVCEIYILHLKNHILVMSSMHAKNIVREHILVMSSMPKTSLGKNLSCLILKVLSKHGSGIPVKFVPNMRQTYQWNTAKTSQVLSNVLKSNAVKSK